MPVRFYKTKLFAVFLFAVAMAWVESAAVVYLRTAVDRLEPHQTNPLPDDGILGPTELVREGATMIMIAALGWLAGGTFPRALAYALVAFGTWDIFYYVFLKILTGWPRSVLDWDILFLIPLPWWGPVLAPGLIAALMIAGGVLMIRSDEAGRGIWPHRLVVAFHLLGVALALLVFMRDALVVLEQGAAAVRSLQPAPFDWPLFLPALALMSTPIWELGWRVSEKGRVRSSMAQRALAGGRESSRADPA